MLLLLLWDGHFPHDGSILSHLGVLLKLKTASQWHLDVGLALSQVRQRRELLMTEATRLITLSFRHHWRADRRRLADIVVDPSGQICVLSSIRLDCCIGWRSSTKTHWIDVSRTHSHLLLMLLQRHVVDPRGEMNLFVRPRCDFIRHLMMHFWQS